MKINTNTNTAVTINSLSLSLSLRLSLSLHIYARHRNRIINSPGLRPNGVSGSPLDGLMVKGSYFNLVLGTPPAHKLHVIEYAKSLWRPFGAPRLDCLWILDKCWIICVDFLTIFAFRLCIDFIFLFLNLKDQNLTKYGLTVIGK